MEIVLKYFQSVLYKNYVKSNQNINVTFTFTSFIKYSQALRDKEKATDGRAAMKINEEELEDSEDEGEELLKQVKDRKQSIAKLNMSPQEKDLIKRLSTAGEGQIKILGLIVKPIFVLQ